MVSRFGKKRLFLVWSCLVSILPGMAQTGKLFNCIGWKDNEISGKFEENGYIKPVKTTFEGVLSSPFDSTK